MHFPLIYEKHGKLVEGGCRFIYIVDFFERVNKQKELSYVRGTRIPQSIVMNNLFNLVFRYCT